MSGQQIRLLVGLGNPGERYAETRHNAGFWLLEEVARRYGGQFRSDARFHGDSCRVRGDDFDLWLLKPGTWMNRSGLAVRAFTDFYKLPPDVVLVVHDEIDLPAGVVRFKRSGGHGGHNGLRDIHAHLGSDQYRRLRIGVGHPGGREEVIGHVLKRPMADERTVIVDAIDAAVDELPAIVRGDFEVAMNRLHSR